jgi:hypothetical protein
MEIRIVMKMKYRYEAVNCPLIPTVLYSPERPVHGKGNDE